MPFQMGYNKEELQGAPPVPAGWYTLQLKGFAQKPSNLKPGQTEPDGLNLNPELTIIGNPDYENRRIFANMSSKAGFILFDFVHACGLSMEEIQDEFAGTEKARYTLPGVWDGSDRYPELKDAAKWKYLGSLTNKTLEVEVAEIPAQTGADGKFYKAKNEIRQFKCAVPGCQEKHSTNLIKS